MSEPTGERGAVADRVLALIDTELVRLGDGRCAEPLAWWEFRQRRWRDGVLVAREYAALHLREVRDAYVADALTRESEALGLYDGPPSEAVLEDLGLEHVGWFVRFPSGIEHIQLTQHSRGDDALVGPYTEYPVYTVGASLSGAQEATDGR